MEFFELNVFYFCYPAFLRIYGINKDLADHKIFAPFKGLDAYDSRIKGLFPAQISVMYILSQALAFYHEYEIVIYKSNDFLSLAIYITLWHVKLTCCK